MTLKDIADVLEKLCPRQLAQSEDVVGLQIGKFNNQVKKILITLDCSKRAIEQAIEKQCQLIISHHPLLWPNREEATKIATNKIKIALLQKHNINVYSLHTNYDLKFLGKEMLRQTKAKWRKEMPELLTIFANLNKEIQFKTLLKQITTWYRVNTVQYWTKKTNQKIKSIALTPGAGGFALETLLFQNIDLLITGELKWNQWIKCRDWNQSVVTIGHQSEQTFISNLKKLLTKKLNKVVKIHEYWEKPIDMFQNND